jgi:hypothetical protein
MVRLLHMLAERVNSTSAGYEQICTVKIYLYNVKTYVHVDIYTVLYLPVA